MKAAVFHAAQDIRVEEVEEPSGPGPHEVLLKPLWCGICGTDLHEFAMGPIVIPSEPHALTGRSFPRSWATSSPGKCSRSAVTSTTCAPGSGSR